MKRCKFIRTTNTHVATGHTVNSIFVPSPTSFFGGWARHQWLKGYFGKECAIVGEEMWNLLVEKYEVKILVEDNGVFWEEREEGPDSDWSVTPYGEQK